jgi:transposase
LPATFGGQLRKQHAAEEKIRIVLDGLRGETSIAELCRREGVAESVYYSRSKESWTPASAGSPETPHERHDQWNQATRREAQDLKEVVAERALAAAQKA